MQRAGGKYSEELRKGVAPRLRCTMTHSSIGSNITSLSSAGTGNRTRSDW